MSQSDNQFDEIVNKIAPTLLTNIIYNDDYGYNFFEKYKILKKSDSYCVLVLTDRTEINFTKLRHAAAWAILDRYNKIVEAKRLKELDRSLSSITTEMQIHKRLQGRGSLESREINRDKYLVASDKQKKIQWELDKYIILAKICQDKGYQNELTRTSRK